MGVEKYLMPDRLNDEKIVSNKLLEEIVKEVGAKVQDHRFIIECYRNTLEVAYGTKTICRRNLR